ncbi:penicillin-binding transpeptidase domain-containing protein [Paramaledivibacter caminithermalis]|jgi:penicillin-binding protein 2|uniref:Penicillin-binding protein 2 n=1 Tax=Paramaledivibacter caminithermalis (strain DSM 15212 / CIP 107654 / DViRD3) TaxID=1121301 RepID=A0A1M6MFE9_PARC5|nr:penicillin-binding transpeptidase domain-containing protein [Paramaledivibacter caminithermalis]SHJ82168.1 penicillin-binding protein 2 [Paramaledivibacter caminithermalis DSM 15212]
MLDKLKDRNNQVILGLILIFLIIFVRLLNLTIVEGEARRAASEDIRKKNISIVAPRGEIRDRNGILIAGNVPSFTVQLVRSELQELNEVAIKIIDILDKNSEEHIEFPIIIRDGEYVYSYDLEINNWLASLGEEYENLRDAEAVFNKIVADNLPIENLDNIKAQEYLIAMGITPPISVSKMKFLPQIKKENFLKNYELDINIDAKEAFRKIRKKYKIDDEYSDIDARKILTIRHALNQLGYLQYKPLRIANDISEKTAILIEEAGMDLPGISVVIEPKRYYPKGEMAAHILGYLGKISNEYEIKKYVNENSYSRNDIIGKTGIEGRYELVLKGENGIKSVEVDTYGRTVKELDYEKKPKPGKDIYLTIDSNLQKVAEESLKHALEEIQRGGTFKSKWGDYKYKESFPNAKAGAVVVTDVNTGEVLALASYPAYDPNLFASGISSKDWQSLQPVNKRDPIAPSPLLNIATITAVQPGSIFKMITGLAAAEEGLDPNKKLYDGGVIRRGSKTFGCWLWNQYRASHGYVDLIKAIEHSCNYYMYDVVNGYDYYKNEPLGIDMNVNKLIDYAKLFGLGESTGIEISEIAPGVPDPDKKSETILLYMERRLYKISKDYFPEDILNDESKLKGCIDEILSWADENPSRGEIIRRLIKMGVEESKLDGLADIIKFDYFNQMDFKEGDAFNLAIGQGSHAYTPVQMARYISAIANGGYLNELTLIKKIADEEQSKEDKKRKIEFNNENILDYIKEGMRRVNATGTARGVFNGFIGVAGKTGTAERDGKIPPLDEVKYLKQHLKDIAPNLSLNTITTESSAIFKQRKEELLALQKESEILQEKILSLKQQHEKANNEKEKEQINKDMEEVKNRKNRVKNEIINKLTRGYFDEGSIMREAIKRLTNNNITDEMIDKFKSDYDNFAWFVSFAPYEKPEIAVVVLLFQGGHGGYGAPIAKEIIGTYLETNAQNLPEDVKNFLNPNDHLN